MCVGPGVYPKTDKMLSTQHSTTSDDDCITTTHTKVSLCISNFLSHSYSCFFIYFFFFINNKIIRTPKVRNKRKKNQTQVSFVCNSPKNYLGDSFFVCVCVCVCLCWTIIETQKDSGESYLDPNMT